MKTTFTLVFVFFINLSYSQIFDPVTFDYSAIKKRKDLYEIHIKALIEPKWHIYSIKNPDGGAQATEINIKNENLVGTIKEKGNMINVFEKEFSVNQFFFEKSVEYIQLVKLKSRLAFIQIEYMACTNDKCLPPMKKEYLLKLPF